jgi:hypothetical protein
MLHFTIKHFHGFFIQYRFARTNHIQFNKANETQV